MPRLRARHQEAPEALILDFGGVLVESPPPGVVERMASLARLPRDQFMARYWQHREAYDKGLTGTEYWQRVLDGIHDLPETVLPQLLEADALSWSNYRADVWQIAAEFRARGNRTALLSNGVIDIIARVRAERDLDRWFDVVIVSCEVGRCKPDPTIYRMCIARLGVPAALTLFVDDGVDNLQAAEAVGLRTLHFTGDPSVGALRKLLDL